MNTKTKDKMEVFDGVIPEIFIPFPKNKLIQVIVSNDWFSIKEVEGSK